MGKRKHEQENNYDEEFKTYCQVKDRAFWFKGTHWWNRKCVIGRPGHVTPVQVRALGEGKAGSGMWGRKNVL